MADLRAAGEPGAVHVPEAARGQAALFRRHPARGRRLPDASSRSSRTKRRRSGWRIRSGTSTTASRRSLALDLSYGILLNLASVANAEEKAQLWGFITRYRPDATPQTAPFLDKLVGYAINYYRDFVKPTKQLPRAERRSSARRWPSCCAYLERAPANADAETCRPRSTRSASAIRSRSCAPGSRRCTKCCWARTRARASAPSSRSTGARRPPT